MAVLSDEKVASLTRRLVDTAIDYKRQAELLAMDNEKLRAALQAVDDEHGYGLPPETRQMIRAALGEKP